MLNTPTAADAAPRLIARLTQAIRRWRPSGSAPRPQPAPLSQQFRRQLLCWAGACGLALAAPAQAQSAPPPAGPGAYASPHGPAVVPTELNRANQAELEMVRGIGPALSEQLLRARAQRVFADWADFIGRTRGIGPVRAQRLSEAGLRINGLAYTPAAPLARPSASSAR